MKYKIFAVLCVLCILSGCKVELPPQSAASSSGRSAVSSDTVSSQNESTPESSSAPNSQTAPLSSQPSSVPSPKAAPTPSSSTPVQPKAAPPAAVQNKEQKCTLSISCSDILNHKDQFSEDKLSIVPNGGVIFAEKSIVFQNGETVFDVLVRETKENKIQMEHTSSPMYQTNYIKGIDNIYEKDFGSESGWMYTVNGKQPPVGCSGYKLKNGDKIQWLFVCSK